MTPTERPETETSSDPPPEWEWYEEQVRQLNETFSLPIATAIAQSRY